MYRHTKIAEPDWMKEAIKSSNDTTRLILENRVPENIKGWMIVVMCRRLLRCVYGSDRLAAKALLSILMEDINIEKEYRKYERRVQ